MPLLGVTQERYDAFREAHGLKWRMVHLVDADERRRVLRWLGWAHG